MRIAYGHARFIALLPRNRYTLSVQAGIKFLPQFRYIACLVCAPLAHLFADYSIRVWVSHPLVIPPISSEKTCSQGFPNDDIFEVIVFAIANESRRLAPLAHNHCGSNA